MIRNILLAIIVINAISSISAQSAEVCQSTIQGRSLCFIENAGQIGGPDGEELEDVRFYLVSGNVTIYFRNSGISYIFSKTNNIDENPETEFYRTDLLFENINTSPAIEGRKQLKGKYNFYSEKKPEGIRDVSSYEEIVYQDIYKNIDLLFYTNQSSGNLKYDFIVRPGGNPNDISFMYKGVESVELNDNRIIATTPMGDIKEMQPYVYTLEDKKEINSYYQLAGNRISFKVENYNAEKTLIIDPALVWSTYFGGDDGDHSTGVAVDYENSIIITGYTLSRTFPVSNLAYQSTRAGFYDAFVTKFNVNGEMQWSTYFGGNETDYAQDICVDEQGKIYIVGFTWSRYFPVTPGSHQTIFGGGITDGFAAQFSKDGYRIWATYYGGTNTDHIYAVASRGKDEIAFTGWTNSKDLATSPIYLPPDTTNQRDAFVTRLLTYDGDFLWGTYLSGDSTESGQGISYIGNGLVVAGFTDSPNFPIVKRTLFDKLVADEYDFFITRFDLTQDLLLDFSNIYGGSFDDHCFDLASDGINTIYITGYAESSNFPVSNDAFQAVNRGKSDGIIMKFDGMGNKKWATYFGGNDADNIESITMDKYKSIAFTGSTKSSNLPITLGAFQPDFGGQYDAIAGKFDSLGTRLYWSTYIGGAARDEAHGCAVDDSTNVIISGSTNSVDFPTTAGSEQPDLAKDFDAFLLKLCSTEPLPLIEIFGETEFCPGDSVVLKVSKDFYRYIWSNNYRTRQVTIREPGTYSVTVIDSGGCRGISDEVQITVYEKPVPVIAGKLGFCIGESTTISVEQDFVSYEWSTKEKTKSITVDTPGFYSVTVIDTNGCEGTIIQEIEEYALPKKMIHGPKVVCAYSENVLYKLTAIAEEKYKWSVKNGTLTYGVDSISVIIDWDNQSPGIIYVETFNTVTGCRGFDSIEVTVSDKLEPDILSNTGSFDFCDGDTLILSPVGNYFYYEWNTGSRDSAIAVTESAELWVLVKDETGCEGADTIVVTKHPLPDPKITGLEIVCENQGDYLYSTDFLSGNSYLWEISGGDFESPADSEEISVHWNEAGTGKLILTETISATGCAVSDTIDIIINPKPDPKITNLGPDIFCDGDSTMLDAGPGFKTYLWSNGATEQTTWIFDEGEYTVTVTNEFDCAEISREAATITVLPKPEKPIISRDEDTLYSTPEYEYQWYMDGEVFSGATDIRFEPDTTGIYYVKVTNSDGCSNISDEMYFWKGSAIVNIRLPDTINVRTDKNIKIPIRIIKSEHLPKVNASEFSAYFTFNRSVLLPTGNFAPMGGNGNLRHIRIDGILEDTLGLIAEPSFITALGDSECSDVLLDSVIFKNAPVILTSNNSVVCLLDLCNAGGATRLFSAESGEIFLEQNRPNPFMGKTEIRFSILEPGPAKIFITDAVGRLVDVIYEGLTDPGAYSLDYYPEKLPSGVYFYTLRTRSHNIVRRMEIIK